MEEYYNGYNYSDESELNLYKETENWWFKKIYEQTKINQYSIT